MPYCPNCSADVGEAAISCPKCSASFSGNAAWKPTATPLAHPPAAGSESSAGTRVVKGLFAIPLILIGVVLLVLAGAMGSNGGALAGVPAVLCLLVAAGIAVSRSSTGLTVSLILGALLLLLLWGVLHMVGAAIYSR